MSTATLLPLRERKRIATWTLLHEAAATLALEHESLQAVTIEAIVDQAGVSARTFFNYFTTKEDAILGFSEPAVDPEALQRFTDSTAPLLGRVADFYFDVMSSSRTSGAGRQRRLAIVDRHPELSNRQVMHFAHVERLVHQSVVDNLHDEPLPASVPTLSMLVDVLVLASSTAYRVTARRSIGLPNDDAERDAMHTALIQLREVSQQLS